MIAVLLVAGVAGLVLFVVLEERRRPDVALLLAVGVTTIDSILFPQQDGVPIGLFRPAIAGQDVRAVDVIILAALAARLLVRGLPRRWTGEGLLWSCLFVWYAIAGVVGMTRSQPTELILFQEKFVLETGGMAALAAGVPLDLLTRRKVIDRLGLVGGTIATVAMLLAVSGVSVGLPIAPGAQIGSIKPDAATMLFTLGSFVLVVGACRDRPNRLALLGGAVMVCTPLVADQRAAIAGAMPVVALMALAMNGRTWRRRSPVRIAGLIPLAAVILVPMSVLAVNGAGAGEGTEAVPFVSRLGDTFGSEQKLQSADVRVGIYDQGRELFEERPLLGHGLGQPIRILDFGSDLFIRIGDFHNVLIDLAVRTGAVGLALYLTATAVTLLAARRRWRSLVHDAYAALVLAAGAALAGLFIKGLFETIFQKFRLAMLLGLLIGIIAAAANERHHEVKGTSAAKRELAWT